MKNKLSRNEQLFLIMLFFILLIWMIIIPFNEGPDEAMRYLIPKFIYNYHYLPRGDDIRILESSWGISYAFSPILTYMISSVFMGIGAIFNSSNQMLLYYARLVSVLFSVGTGYFCIKIGNQLFKNSYKWLFVFLVTFLPQFQFISGYVNCDSIATFSVTFIIYSLIVGHKNLWDFKSCLILGVAIGICLLSYYNTYGIILITVIYCIFDVLINNKIENKFIFILQRVFWVFVPAFLIAGWWFIRNFIIYNGDVLGRAAAFKCQEKYAVFELKPSNKMSLYDKGISLKTMFIDMGWANISFKSFIGTFSSMSVFLPDYIYNLYILLLATCGGAFIKFIKYYKTKRTKKTNLFYWSLVLMCIISVFISLYYSYTTDYQPQGRYCFSMLIPLCILISKSICFITSNLNICKNVKIRYNIVESIPWLIIYLCVLIDFYALFKILVDVYY